METQTIGARRGPKPRPQVRENLLRVGMKIFHKNGYTATGIKDIVDAAQVPKGSFYNYFENKETFAKEAVDFYFERRLTKLRELLTHQETPALERLHHYFESRVNGAQLSDYTRGCLLGNFSLEIADHSPLIRERLAAHFQTWSELIEHCIQQAQDSKTIQTPMPAKLLAQFLLNSWEGALLRMRVEHSDAPLKQFMTVVFGAVLV